MKLYNPEDITIQTFDDSDAKRTNLAQIFPYSDRGSKERISELQTKGAGIYFATNPQADGLRRGTEHTKTFQYLSLDLDVGKEKAHSNKEDLENKKQRSLDRLKSLPVPPYGVVFTKNGLQPVWKFADPYELKSKEERIKANGEYQGMVRAVTQVLGHKSEGDSICRVIRLPGSLHLKTPADPYKIIYQEISGRECTFEEFNKDYPAIVSDSGSASKDVFDWTKITGTIEGEGRNDKLLRATRSAYARGIPEDSILDMMAGLNQTFKPPLSDDEFKETFGNAKGYADEEANKKSEVSENKIPWPSPLNEAAYYGVIGRLVKLIEPETEADPAAILIGSLVSFGSIIGRGAYLEVGPIIHHLNLFNATVGHTAKARKGVASAEVRRFFTGIDTDWEKKCKKPSCSTGEGIIHHIRDRVVKPDDNGEEKVVDPGIDDKRLFVDGDELAATLQTMSRSGNTLSSILRLAYDGLDLSTLTKNNSEKASNPHIAISANITEIELKRLLTEVDLNNGFTNRFLFTAAKRSKELPFGGIVPVLELENLKEELEKAVNFAKTAGQVVFDNQTQETWAYIYHELTSEIPGLVGVLSARTEPLTLRIAAIYAVADRSNKIQLPHLRAALAVMDRETETLFYLFGNSTGDPTAETILAALKESFGQLSKEDIRSNVFSRNKSSDEIVAALEFLETLGKIKKQTIKTPGRDKTVYTLTASTASTAYTYSKKTYLELLDEFINKKGLKTDTQAQNNSEYANAVNAKNAESPNKNSTEYANEISVLSQKPANPEESQKVEPVGQAQVGCRHYVKLSQKPAICYFCKTEYPKNETTPNSRPKPTDETSLNTLPGLEGYGKS